MDQKERRPQTASVNVLLDRRRTVTWREVGEDMKYGMFDSNLEATVYLIVGAAASGVIVWGILWVIFLFV